MTDETAQRAIEAYAGLPTMYVHLSLEIANKKHQNELRGNRQPNRPGVGMPASGDVIVLMNRIIKLVNLPVVDVARTVPWFQKEVIEAYADARAMLGLGSYVQVMVLPCPGCDLRALVHALDAPVIRCEHCALELGLTAYEALVEKRRSGQ
jgi:hypothetical protein